MFKTDMTTKYRIIAALILIVSAALGYFLYSSEVNPNSSHKLHYGLDLSGGTHLVYRADVSNLESPADVNDAMNALRDVIERRVNVFGVSEPLVQVDKGGIGSGGEERLIVELPGVTDVQKAVDAIGKTPLLEFKLYDPNATSTATSSAATASSTGTSTIAGQPGAFVSTGLTGRYLQRAQVGFNQTPGAVGQTLVLLDFNQEGANLFAKITTEHTGQILGIFLDGEPISTPVINEPITGGTAQIEGNFSPTEARELVRSLNLGALPVPIELISTQTVGPTLGAQARSAGAMAGIIGLLVVSIFLIVWYRVPGLIAVVALGTYLVIMLLLFKLIPIVLTSAGVAGFVLSIGMAVDANILIFERMKEEFKTASDMETAIYDGFARAWPSIRDGNISNMISAIIFYAAGTTLTKGFAVTLGLGIIIHLFTAITITRTLLLALGTRKVEGLPKFLYGSGFHFGSREAEAVTK